MYRGSFAEKEKRERFFRRNHLARAVTKPKCCEHTFMSAALLDSEAVKARASWTSACLCVSGSVAAVKAPDLAERLLKRGVSVDLVVTHSAERLLHASYRGAIPWERLLALAEDSVAHAPMAVGVKRSRDAADSDGKSAVQEPRLAHEDAAPRLRIWRDEDEWSNYNTVGSDEVLHVELAKRNQLLLVAPLCANTLAAMALGSCGNLLTSVVRAWYYDLDAAFAAPLANRYGAHTVARPIVVAPAMNTIMWHQRVTTEHLEKIKVRSAPITYSTTWPSRHRFTPSRRLPAGRRVASAWSHRSRSCWPAATTGLARWQRWTTSSRQRSRCSSSNVPQPRNRRKLRQRVGLRSRFEKPSWATLCAWFEDRSPERAELPGTWEASCGGVVRLRRPSVLVARRRNVSPPERDVVRDRRVFDPGTARAGVSCESSAPLAVGSPAVFRRGYFARFISARVATSRFPRA